MEQQLIQPTHFDAVLVTTGLPEVLIASALARAGKAVLVLDAAESYGSSWASLSGADFVHQALNNSLQQAQPVSGQQQQQLGGLQDCSVYTYRRLEAVLDNKGLIIDLAPRVLYQDESLVHLLVSCQAHNYLEFKLVDGNYVFLDGALQPVPASRADLFADRALSLADKRSLGRFMAACVEAAEGSGRLKDAFDSRRLIDLLLVEGLNEHLQQVVLYGIAMADTPQHTTAQSTQSTQQQQQQQQQPLPEQQSATGTAQMASSPAAAAGSAAGGQQQQQQQQQQQHGLGPPSRMLTAAEGLAAFVLYSRSLGRFSGSGALMAPCYGCGSLPEAFVRLAAVKGAVTALRHGTQRMQVLGDDGADAGLGDAAAAAEGGAEGGGGGAAAVQHADAPQQQQQQQQEVQEQQQGNRDSASPPAAAAAVGPVATAPARVRLTLSSGQHITAGCVVSSTSIGNGDSSSSSSGAAASATRHVARAVAVLDGSLVEGDTSLLFVIPPGTLGPWQTAVIRGLQLGHALAVTPPGHCLLYLSAVLPGQQPDAAGDSKPTPSAALTAMACGGASSSSSSGFRMASAAEQMLAPALAAVAAAQQLQQFGEPGEEPPAAAAAAADPSSNCNCQQEQQQQHHQQHEDALGGPVAASTPQRPQVLAACFFSFQEDLPYAANEQQQQQVQQLPTSSSMVRCLQAPAAGFAGYSSSIDQAAALFRQHFPDLPWLTDPQPRQQPAAAGSAAAEGSSAAEGDSSSTGEGPAAATAAAAAGTVSSSTAAAADYVDADEADAIDELTAALMELSAGLEAMPGQGGSTAAQL